MSKMAKDCKNLLKDLGFKLRPTLKRFGLYSANFEMICDGGQTPRPKTTAKIHRLYRTLKAIEKARNAARERILCI